MRKEFFKKIILIIANVLLIAFFVQAVSAVFMPKYTGDLVDGRITSEFYKEKTPIDVIFVGTSVINSGTSPVKLWEDYGITAYNRSNSSQTPWISYYMIKDAIKVNKPKMVMLDVGFFDTGDDYYEDESVRKTFDYMPNSLIKYEAISDTIPADYNMWDYVFPILRYHDRWDDLTWDDFKYAFSIPNQTYNGHTMSLKKSEGVVEGVTYDNGPEFTIPAKSFDYLNRIIKLCKDENVKLVLMRIPANDARWNNDFDEYLGDFAEENGIDYINYDKLKDEMGIDFNEDSNDGGGHLNTYGAEKLTDYIGNDLVNKYGMESHKGDPSYDSIWEKKVEAYEEAKSKAF